MFLIQGDGRIRRPLEGTALAFNFYITAMAYRGDRKLERAQMNGRGRRCLISTDLRRH